jgi:hypothetical protein
VDRETGFVVAEFDRALWLAWPGDRQQVVRARHLARLLRERGVWDELVGGWAAADQRGDAAAALRLAWVLVIAGDEPGSWVAFARAARRGDSSALAAEFRRRRRAGLDTAELERESRRAERRPQQSDRQADRDGDADATYRIGSALLAQWQLDEQERRRIATRQPLSREETLKQAAAASDHYNAGYAALRRAAERGSADAAVELGGLANEGSAYETPYEARARAKRCLPWYRLADERGHARGSWWLGLVLLDLGDVEGAEAALLRAEARGHPHAASSLGLLLSKHRSPPDWAGAEAAYRRAADLGYSGDEHIELAVFLEGRGDLPGAEAARAAGEHNESGA